MKRNLLLFLLSVCFFLPDFAATGQYNFIRVDGGSGLSNSHVKSIIQDSYGFIWLGTRNGLNRYDGVSMKLYNCYDETLQHGNQVISALFEDNHRQLWVGTDDGVYIQELATGKFSFFDARTESGPFSNELGRHSRKILIIPFQTTKFVELIQIRLIRNDRIFRVTFHATQIFQEQFYLYHFYYFNNVSKLRFFVWKNKESDRFILPLVAKIDDRQPSSGPFYF